MFRSGLLCIAIVTGNHPASILMAETRQDHSVLAGLPGFDSNRLVKIGTGIASESPSASDLNEAARLLFRIRRIPPSLWAESIKEVASGDLPGETVIGSAVRTGGVIESLQRFDLSDSMAPFVEFQSIEQWSVGGTKMIVAMTEGSDRWKVGDSVTVAGVWLGDKILTAREIESVAKDVSQIDDRWVPLATAGGDVRAVAAVRRAGRGPLTSVDADTFYDWLVAADKMRPTPAAATPAARLLTDADRLIGCPVKVSGEIVRTTRVNVEHSRRRRQIGTDHYFQVDLMVRLDNQTVVLRPPPGTGPAADSAAAINERSSPADDGNDIAFGRRYPVTLVSRQPPPGFRDGLIGSNQRRPVTVAGFYYRLWSYESELTRGSGGRSISPLIMVGRYIEPTPSGDRTETTRPIGIAAMLGVAGGLAAMMAATFYWRRGDRRASDLRRR